MTRITHVLCPVDFSETSQHAVDHASAIARWYNARLTLLFVFANLPSMDLPPLVLEEADRALLMRDMRRMTARVPPQVSLDLRVHEAGYVHDEILAQVAATPADFLVLGTHGRSGFQRLFLGSVTEKVIRKAPCPTLVVPPRAADVAPDAPVQFRRILCPIDFSESSIAALAQAIDLAEQADAQLTLLHVLEMPPILSPELIVLEPMREATVSDARRRLHDLIPAQARTRSTVETAVVEGRAYPEILRHAAVQPSDLVVMGVHGRGVIDRLIFGSTTHHVIRGAACPVLIVRGA